VKGKQKDPKKWSGIRRKEKRKAKDRASNPARICRHAKVKKTS
jgi:hypothetical protein